MGNCCRRQVQRNDAWLPRKEIRADGIGHAMFIIDNPGRISDFYDIYKDEKLGEGSYGRVCKCSNKSTGVERAVKILRKVNNQKVLDNFMYEIAIMKLMDHPNIVRLFEHFEDDKFLYLVMELCDGGELFDRLLDAGHFSEPQAAFLMQQALRCVYYMHAHGICHRDLKMENFLFSNEDRVERNVLKVADFGLACNLQTEDQQMTTKCGAPYYVAPQVLAGRYDKSCDVWTLGVIMYTLLCGYPPFFGESDAEVLAKVRVGVYTFNAADWKHVSEDAKNLIRGMLKINPADRYSARQALQHPWITEKAPVPEACIRLRCVENMRAFNSMNLLKKATLQILAVSIPSNHTSALSEMFMALDSSGEGTVSAKELEQGFKKSFIAEIPDDLEEVLSAIDADGSGNIDYTEFLAATLDPRVYIKEEFCWAAFRIFDRNGDGKIGESELWKVLNGGEHEGGVNRAYVAELLKDVDANGDGFIDFGEFMTMMRGTGRPGEKDEKPAKKKKTKGKSQAKPDADSLSAPDVATQEYPEYPIPTPIGQSIQQSAASSDSPMSQEIANNLRRASRGYQRLNGEGETNGAQISS